MKAQLVVNEQEPLPLPPMDMAAFSPPPAPNGTAQNGAAPTRRYNSFGILEDIPPEELATRAPVEESKRDRKDKKRK